MGDGGEGEGEMGEGEDSGRGRSAMKPVTLTELVVVKNNNQPMMVMTESGGIRVRWSSERQVREVR